MIAVKVITVGGLKESYLREAVAEYEKRLGALCRFSLVELKEERLPEDPSEREIAQALEKEAVRIREKIPQKAYAIAMCVEGKQLASEELAASFERIAMESDEICLVIGSSYGLAESLKRDCRMRLSVSKLTFPHQLMRVILMEAVYRAFQIQKGTKYHK